MAWRSARSSHRPDEEASPGERVLRHQPGGDLEAQLQLASGRGANPRHAGPGVERRLEGQRPVAGQRIREPALFLVVRVLYADRDRLPVEVVELVAHEARRELEDRPQVLAP